MCEWGKSPQLKIKAAGCSSISRVSELVGMYPECANCAKRYEFKRGQLMGFSCKSGLRVRFVLNRLETCSSIAMWVYILLPMHLLALKEV